MTKNKFFNFTLTPFKMKNYYIPCKNGNFPGKIFISRFFRFTGNPQSPENCQPPLWPKNVAFDIIFETLPRWSTVKKPIAFHGCFPTLITSLGSAKNPRSIFRWGRPRRIVFLFIDLNGFLSFSYKIIKSVQTMRLFNKRFLS